MALFQPITNIYICQGVPLDNRYINTITWDNIDNQVAYYKSKAIINYPESSYQRIERYTDIKATAESLVNANYIIFQNANYGNKWYFAFITSVEYVAEQMSRVRFEVDAWQTYYFDVSIKPSFVRREHTNNDTIGANTVPEGLELGPYVTTSSQSTNFDGMDIYCFATEQIEVGAPWSKPGNWGGLPISTYFIKIPSIADIAVLLESAATAGKADAIVSIFCVPSNVIWSAAYNLFETGITMPSANLNYSPKNNKLYTYPYCVGVLEGPGSSIDYRYELMGDDRTVRGACGFGPNPTAYLGIAYDGHSVFADPSYVIQISGWPILPYVTNYYQNWVARQGPSLIAGVATSALSAGVSVGGAIASGGVTAGQAIAASANLLTTVTNSLMQVYQSAITPDSIHGNVAATNALIGSGAFKIIAKCKAIRPEYAKIIDDYFTKYGYKTNQLKIPNITGRRSYNFVQTVGATVAASIPNTYLDTIINTLDSGITFWHTTDVGNYNLPNEVI